MEVGLVWGPVIRSVALLASGIDRFSSVTLSALDELTVSENRRLWLG